MGFFKQKKPQESRQHSRIENSLRISYQIANDAMHADCLTTDISEGGIRLNLFKRLEVGTTIKLCIYFQDLAQPTYVIGKVAWIKKTPDKKYPYEAGIQFDFFDPAFSSQLQGHLQSLLQKKTFTKNEASD
jgi:Tfp pilus assembly protein PilZ